MISDNDLGQRVTRPRRSLSLPGRELQDALLGEEITDSSYVVQHPTILRYDPLVGAHSSAQLSSCRAESVSVMSTAGAAALLNTPKFIQNASERHAVDTYPGISGAVADDKTTLPTRNKTMLAVVLIVLTDIVATLQSTALKVLRDRGYGVFNLLLVSSVVGLLFAGSVLAIRCTPLLSERSAWLPMLERGFLGGVANLCAFYAVSTLNLGVASCLMFTMPLWTAALAYIFAGQKWGRYDIILAISCLVGVVLVTQLWDLESSGGSDGSTGSSRALGLIAALAFAIINADAALVVNTKLRNEAPMAMVFSTMIFAVVLALLLEAATGSGVYDWRAPAEDNLLVLALSLGLPIMMFTRNLAFSLNPDTTIAMLLYLEIALAFLWEDVLLSGGAPSPTQVAGALLIVCGSCCSAILKSRATEVRRNAVEAIADVNGGKSPYHGIESAAASCSA